MPVRKKTQHKAPGQGMSAKQRKRRKPIDEAYMIPIEPLTHNQQVFFDEWDKGQSMFEMPDDNSFEMLYDNLKAQETISFWSTSFIRGTTLDNSIVIVDECQNLNFHELDSIITRVGQDTKIIFCGDASQTDLVKVNERSGILDFQRILQNMEEFSLIEYGIDDIVRSGLVKSYIINKINLGL